MFLPRVFLKRYFCGGVLPMCVVFFILATMTKVRTPPKEIRTEIDKKSSGSSHPFIFDADHFAAASVKYPVDTGQCMNSTTWPVNFVICPHELDRDLSDVGFVIRDAGNWEPVIADTIAKALMAYPKSWLLDLGANIGIHSLLGAKMGHSVLAVEPMIINLVNVRIAVR